MRCRRLLNLGGQQIVELRAATGYRRPRHVVGALYLTPVVGRRIPHGAAITRLLCRCW